MIENKSRELNTEREREREKKMKKLINEFSKIYYCIIFYQSKTQLLWI